MTVSDVIKKEIGNLFGSFSGNIIPKECKDLVDETLSIIKKDGGPEITLQYDPESDGYLPSYDGVTYGAGQSADMILAIENSPFVSENVLYGTIGLSTEQNDYSAAHFLERMQTFLSRPGSSASVVGTALTIPGSRMSLTVTDGTASTPPALNLVLGPDQINLLPDPDLWGSAHSGDVLTGYIYVNYQAIKSNDGDVAFKCFLSDTASGEGNNSSLFADRSINHYATANNYYDFDPPKVHHALDHLDGGFALLQYDAASADEIEWNTSYGYGILLMNTNAAPLIFITEDSNSISRTTSTSLSNLGGQAYSDANELLLTPCASDAISTALLAPVITPSSGKYRSMRSRWACMGSTDIYTAAGGSRKIGAGFTTFFVDHGLCLGGGADI